MSRFIYATRANVPDYMVKSGITYRLILDHLGSVRLVVNTQDGSVAQRLDYDEFGQVTQNTNPGFQPFGFAGGILDTHTGLLRFGGRDYDPYSGRWTSKDAFAFASGVANLYEYVEDDPIDYSDPFGFWPCPPRFAHSDREEGWGNTDPGLLDPVMWAAGGVPGGIRAMGSRLLLGGTVKEVTIGAGAEAGEAGARVFYGTPGGQLIEAPPGYEAITAENGKGIVLKPEGQPLGDNSNIIRYGEPTEQYPGGYIRYYNAEGQPLNPVTGQPGPQAATHIPAGYQGPLNGYPGR